MAQQIALTNKGKTLTEFKDRSIKWRCTNSNSRARMISKYGKHSIESNPILEAKMLCMQVKRKAVCDISPRSSKVIRSELQDMPEESLSPSDICKAAKALYRSNRNQFPTVPKCSLEVHESLQNITLNIPKSF